MRTTILTIMLTLPMFAGIELAKADNSIPNNPEIPIILLEEDREKGRPRTLVQDIEAYHTNTMVYLTLNENLGQANIVISNANTGAQVETSVPTNCSNVQVDISSLGQGDFEIVINTAEGIYTGAFCL